MNPLNNYYRIPEPWVSFSCKDTVGSENGFFTFGEDVVCFGRCSTAPVSRTLKFPLPDLFKQALPGKNSVTLPFDLDDVVTNLQRERYVSAMAMSRLQRSFRNIYYRLRPRLGVRVRKYLQRAYLSGWEKIPFPRWPVDRSVDRLMERALALGLKASGADCLPFIWFWPEGQASCCIVTHDVETGAGRDFCSTLMDLDEACGMRSAFQVVPELRYQVPSEFLDTIRQRGFELNVHDLNHDGMLFSDEKTFMQRVAAINRYGKEYRARGFRSGVMYRNQDWYHALDFEYDMSVPNVAHLEPQRGGCSTIMPYFIGKVLELPLTTTQDYTLFHILGSRSLNIWKREIEAVHSKHGLISILTHPDYLLEKWAQDIYLQLLRHIADRAEQDNIWLATPAEVNDWWRIRNKLSLVQGNGQWLIVGKGSVRARIAYAYLDGNDVRYSFEPPIKKKTGSLTVLKPAGSVQLPVINN